MTGSVYVDSGAWIALLRPKDAHHAAVAKHFRAIRRKGTLMITSEVVISETATRLRYDSGIAAVQAFRDLIDDGVQDGSLRVRESTPAIRAKALDLLARYRDLDLSYADAVGAVIARTEHVDAIFGLDNDFRVMGFVVEP